MKCARAYISTQHICSETLLGSQWGMPLTITCRGQIYTQTMSLTFVFVTECYCEIFQLRVLFYFAMRLFFAVHFDDFIATYFCLNNAGRGNDSSTHSLTYTRNKFSILVQIIYKKNLSNGCFGINFDTYNILWLNLNRVFIIIHDFSEVPNGFKIINANHENEFITQNTSCFPLK